MCSGCSPGWGLVDEGPCDAFLPGHEYGGHEDDEEQMSEIVSLEHPDDAAQHCGDLTHCEVD